MYTEYFTLTLTTEKKLPIQDDLMHCPSRWVVACRTVLTTTKVNDNNVCAALLPPTGCPIDAITQGHAHRVQSSLYSMSKQALMFATKI
jgi:hypothetical protein